MRKLSLPNVRWRRRLGIEPKTRKLTEEDKRKIVALYKEGYTQQEIAGMMGVDQSRISRTLQQYANDQMIIRISDTSSKSEPSVVEASSSSSEHDEKLIDATPYLKGGGTEFEGSEEQEVFGEEVRGQEYVVEYGEDDFEEPEEVITTPIAEARRGWEMFKSAIEALMKV